MANHKKKTSSTPRRKRYNRNARLQNAKKWADQYNGKNLAKGYSNWFGVDILCAITELEMLGYQFKQSYKEQVKQSVIAKQKQKELHQCKKDIEEDYGDENFYYIVGYTSNGFPYGVTREEMEEEHKEISKQPKKHFDIDDDDRPF